MATLVTGGAGYIGSHIVRTLQLSGQKVVVADNFQSGSRERLGDVEVVEVDLTMEVCREPLNAAVHEFGVDAVIHMAALKQAGESVEQPVRYFHDNVASLINVLRAIEGTGVDRFVFSSSAAVYGNPDEGLVTEDAPTRPINPYGGSKLAGEWLVRDVSIARGLRTASLRYFNVAGAGAPDLGDPVPMNLVTRAIGAIARGRAPQIFGNDYPTLDGTGVRDYIHVQDLAAAHIAALEYLAVFEGGASTFNVGTGRGASVKEVLDELRRASGVAFQPEVVARRAGDPAAVVADPSRIRAALAWTPQHDLRSMVESAWDAREVL